MLYLLYLVFHYYNLYNDSIYNSIYLVKLLDGQIIGSIELDGKKYNFNKNVTLTTNDTWITIYSKTIYGISHNDDSGNLKAMKMSDKLLFLDDNNNVYECQMKYVGKNKKK